MNGYALQTRIREAVRERLAYMICNKEGDLMSKIGTPRDPKPSDDVMGPNHPSTVDPGFGAPYRDRGGDVGSTTRVAGRRPEPRPIENGIVTEGPKGT